METLEIDGRRPINLAWGQKMAAFWSISWPTAIISLIVDLALQPALLVGWFRPEAIALSRATPLLAIACQSLFVWRLFRKRYRTFRVEVFRDGVLSTPALAVNELMQVALRIIWPQVAVFALQALVLFLLSGSPARFVGFVRSLFSLVRFFIVGPYAVSFAVSASYAGFRLQCSRK